MQTFTISVTDIQNFRAVRREYNFETQWMADEWFNYMNARKSANIFYSKGY
jgi:hypothetical protein